MSGPPTIQDHVGQPLTPGHEVEFEQRQASEDARLTTLEEHTPHVSEAVSSDAERERQHEALALDLETLETRKKQIQHETLALETGFAKLVAETEQHVAAFKAERDQLQAERDQLHADQEQLRKNKMRIDALALALDARLQKLLKREEQVKLATTTDRAQATTTVSQPAAYHVQGGTTAAKFERVIDDVRDRSGIPTEWFVSAEPEHTYPLVLLFVKPSGPRLADGVVKYEEVEVCRKMVAPGGSLFICTMRAGNDPQAAKSLPAGCPPVEGLLDFCYISGDARKPHTLNQASNMNDRSTRELAEAFKKVRPPSPQIRHRPRLQIVGPITCLGKAVHKCYLVVVRCVSAIAESVGGLPRGHFSPHRL